jgi:hypothetical protein
MPSAWPTPNPLTRGASEMDAALTNATNWLADHPWSTCALLCAMILIAGNLDRVLP